MTVLTVCTQLRATIDHTLRMSLHVTRSLAASLPHTHHCNVMLSLSACNSEPEGRLRRCFMQIIASWKFDWRYMVRGLTIDKQRGNILKIDRHKYVKIAYHGFRELSRAERRAIYSNTNVCMHMSTLHSCLSALCCTVCKDAAASEVVTSSACDTCIRGMLHPMLLLPAAYSSTASQSCCKTLRQCMLTQHMQKRWQQPHKIDAVRKTRHQIVLVSISRLLLPYPQQPFCHPFTIMQYHAETHNTAAPESFSNHKRL